MSNSFERVASLAEVAERRPTYLAIGVFDGVHLGHQRLLHSMVAAARESGARPAVLTFHPHPSAVIQNARGRIYLCSLEERVTLLGQLGVDLVIIHPFNQEVRQTRAADFVDQLCRALDLSELWGASFGLGYNREGDLQFLQQLGQEKGFRVHQFESVVTWHGGRVSSSRIRRALDSGDIQEVTGCLGRPYRIGGTVIAGDGRGKALGFPTANIQVWEQLLLPANGVYASYAWLEGRRYAAAANIGIRPTVDGHSLTVEAHLLDFDGRIYGQELTLDIIDRIRDERKFNGLDALVAQIQADVATVRQRLVSSSSPAR